MNIDKIFAAVDRKVDSFDFSIKKVKGAITGNEYYITSGKAPVGQDTFTMKTLSVGCPQKPIETIANALLAKVNSTRTGGSHMITLRPATIAASAIPTPEAPAVQEATRITLTPATPPALTLQRIETSGRLTLAPVDYDEEEDYEEDCDEDEDHYCAYCGRNFPTDHRYKFCPSCGEEL